MEWIAETFDHHAMLDASEARKLGGVGSWSGRWTFPDGSELHLNTVERFGFGNVRRIDTEWIAVAPHVCDDDCRSYGCRWRE